MSIWYSNGTVTKTSTVKSAYATKATTQKTCRCLQFAGSGELFKSADILVTTF